MQTMLCSPPLYPIESILMKFLRHLIATSLIALSSMTHAFTTLPADGLWGVVSEQNLAVGRAFNLEMAGGILIVTIYAYNAQGAPTFYAGGAALTANNTAAVALSEPQGGTCFGCAVTGGRLLSSPGVATFEFTTSTTGYVTLPGEARKAIVKGELTRPVGPDSLRGAWAFTYILSSTFSVGETPSFTTNLGATASGSGLMVSSDGRTGCELQITGSLAGYVVCIKTNSSGTTDKVMLLKMFGHRMDGIWYYNSSPGTTYVLTSHRFLDGAANAIIVKRAPAFDGELLRAAMNTAVLDASNLLSNSDQ